jgi:hypothetical protein
MAIPISLIVDDGAPVNPLYCTHPAIKTRLLVPNSFTEEFADFCVEHGVRGKFSVLPMPTELGRLDERLNYVSAEHLQGFLRIARRKIARQFDITPEILTHRCAYDLRTGGMLHVFEDVWFETASLDEMTDYIALAFRILKNVGLPANGVTSPWSTGIKQEKMYARAIARAQWRVHRRRFSWYFLHTLRPATARWPWVAWRNRSTGQTVVSVPSTTGDEFWRTQHQPSRSAARSAAEAGVNELLSRDGRRGQVRELFENRMPIVLLTHWQSLFSDGFAAGLKGFQRAVKRIEDVFGDEVEWVTCSRLARMAAERPRHLARRTNA